MIYTCICVYCVCVKVIRSSKNDLSLSLSHNNVAHIGHFFDLVGLLKRKCVYTQVFAHNKKYVIPIEISLYNNDS